MRPVYKNLVRTLLLLLVFAAIVPFVYPLKNGKPLLSLDRLKLPSLPEIPLPDTSAGNSEIVTAYKWRDAEGNWHFGNKPPQGASYEAIELDPNVNLIQGVKTAQEAAPSSGVAAEKTTQAGEMEPGYTPEKIQAMMEKARQARDALDAHHRSLEELDN